MPKSPAKLKSKPEGKLEWIELTKLGFDLTNPRYGPDAPKQSTDEEAIAYIFDHFDMSDVLSSISVNGYFDSEPLVGTLLNNGKIRVLEGNRRLAACLLLTKDPRACETLLEDYEDYISNLTKPIVKVPVIVHQQGDLQDLMAYLGVRHIVGGKPWDSYAKAHWIATTLGKGNSGLDLTHIKRMLGDTTGFTERLLCSYYFVEQLKQAGLFDPADSVKKGRGSASFPFSLVYNILDVRNLREWLGFKQAELQIDPDPIPKEREEDASRLLKLICGSKKEEFVPAIKENRQLPVLASAVQNPVLFGRLVNGQPLEQVELEARPSGDRLLFNLGKVEPLLGDALKVVNSDPPKPIEAKRLLPLSMKIGKLAIKIFESLEEIKERNEQLEFDKGKWSDSK